MCRLFGLTAGSEPVKATLWLLEEPDSLAQQSRRNPDGYGIAVFDRDGTPQIDKRPTEAYEDKQFAREAKELESTTFVAHVRYASTGARTVANTHPFEQRGRVFAHNGHIGALPELEARLGEDRRLVGGDTDSERLFALITREIDAHGGDVGAGIAAAARWVAAELPLFSLNFLIATPSELWAFRYPETHQLMILERSVGGPSGARHLDAASSAGTVRLRSGDLGARASVLFASEQMDEDGGWRLLAPGELVRVDHALRVSSTVAVDFAPAHPLRLEDLDPRAAASQHHGPRS
jgi:predicted glutamine amidotransferase